MFMSQTELFAWILGQYPRSQQNNKFLIRPYYYPIDLVTINNGVTKSGNITIAANGDFVILSMNYRATIDDSNRDIVPQVKVQITDTGSSWQFASSAVDIATFMGHVQNAPYVTPWPYMVAGRSSLQVDATSYASAEDYATLTITFWGLLVQSLGPMGAGDSDQFVYRVFDDAQA